MIDVNIKGTVNEIVFKSDKSIRFIIANDEGELLATITRSKLELADKLQIGQAYTFVGNITVYRRIKGDKTFIDNTFYVTKIKEKRDVGNE